MSKEQKEGRFPQVTKPRVALVGSGLTAAGGGMLATELPVELAVGTGVPGLACLAGVFAAVKTQQSRDQRKAMKARGAASAADVRRTSGRRAAAKMTKVLSPSSRNLPLARRAAKRVVGSTKGIATPMARAGWTRLYATVEDVTLRVGGPRSGKTGELACRVLDAPGALICGSTRTDLWEITRDERAKTGPVWVFNPPGIGGVASDVYFDPLAECKDPKVVAERVEDMLPMPQETAGDRSYWVDRARATLQMLMHAAALGELPISQVHTWVTMPTAAVHRHVVRLLEKSPQAAGYVANANQFFSMTEGNQKTQSSIVSAVLPALNWCTDAGAIACTTPGADNERVRLDPDMLLDQQVQLYLLGEPNERIAPLLTAMVGWILRRVKHRATLLPGGRLDPAMTLALDEVTRVCTLPLPDWTSWHGGHNITYHLATQSRAQLRAKWGDLGGRELWSNANVLCVFGGIKDDQELQSLATLIGEVNEPVPTWDSDGKLQSSSTRPVPIFRPSDIAQLPKFHCIVLRQGCKPVRGVARMAWDRPRMQYTRLLTSAKTAWSSATAASRGVWSYLRARPVDPDDTSGIEDIFQPTIPQQRPALRVVRDDEQEQERQGVA